MSLKYTTLGKYATIQGGYAYKSQDFQSTGKWPVLKIKNIKNGMVSYDDISFVAEDIASATQKWMTKEGDVLISMTGSGPSAPDSLVGKVARVWQGEKRALINQRVGRVVLKNNNEIDSDFLFYLLSSKECQNYLVSNSTGSANQVNISSKLIESVKCPIISFSASKEIAEILKSLDTKIRLLSETNSTLESIAQALFKSWFIDFDPVHAKAEGREPEGMDAETAALFPDSFESSELGLVPKKWGAKAVYDIATYINGASYRSFEPNDERRGLPIIKIAELKSGVTIQTRYSSVNMPDKFKINYGDILFSWSGNPDTSIDTFIWSQGVAWLNQHIFRVLPHSNQERSFVLMTLRYLKPVFAEIARNKQTTGLGHVTVADLKRLKIVIPPSTIMDRWNAIVTPILEQAFIMDCRSKILSHLRDTLLPRLVSGQLTPEKVGEMV